MFIYYYNFLFEVVLLFYFLIVIVNVEGDLLVSDDILEGLGMMGFFF